MRTQTEIGIMQALARTIIYTAMLVGVGWVALTVIVWLSNMLGIAALLSTMP